MCHKDLSGNWLTFMIIINESLFGWIPKKEDKEPIFKVYIFFYFGLYKTNKNIGLGEVYSATLTSFAFVIIVITDVHLKSIYLPFTSHGPVTIISCSWISQNKSINTWQL